MHLTFFLEFLKETIFPGIQFICCIPKFSSERPILYFSGNASSILHALCSLFKNNSHWDDLSSDCDWKPDWMWLPWLGLVWMQPCRLKYNHSRSMMNRDRSGSCRKDYFLVWTVVLANCWQDDDDLAKLKPAYLLGKSIPLFTCSSTPWPFSHSHCERVSRQQSNCLSPCLPDYSLCSSVLHPLGNLLASLQRLFFLTKWSSVFEIVTRIILSEFSFRPMNKIIFLPRYSWNKVHRKSFRFDSSFLISV